MHVAGSPARRSSMRAVKRATEMDRNKRKSEVLIAAQSLDVEVQNVKHLKRLSIGSMDLLIDPELEFRVNSTPELDDTDARQQEKIKQINRRSWSAGKSIEALSQDFAQLRGTQENEPSPDASMDTSGEDDASSMEVTHSEYLSHEPVFADLQGRNPLVKTISSSSSSSSSHRVTDTKDRIDDETHTQIPVRDVSSTSASANGRKLSGAGFLRRGSSAVSQTARKLSGTADLKSNLLWVPANQHPNVKPENYLELVHDTLQTINGEGDGDGDGHTIDTSADTGTAADSVDESDKENNNTRLRVRYRNGKASSLVRRPSRLRRSYIETDEDEDSNTSNAKIDDIEEGGRSLDERKPTRTNGDRKSVSLRDITEELTKMSNSVGLTDDDAVTLARTLNMTCTYTDTDSEGLDNLRTDSKEQLRAEESENPPGTTHAKILPDENQFASNMFMKNGLSIPTRSSLRRSKFNTYRIRTTSAPTPLVEKPKRNNSRHARLSFVHLDDEEFASHESPAALQSPTVNNDEAGVIESPGSISDLYDHYTGTASEPGSPDVSEDKELKEDMSREYSTDDNDFSTNTSHDSSFLSNESSNDSVLYRPTNIKPMISENFDAVEQEDEETISTAVAEPTKNDNNNNTNSMPWSWLAKDGTDIDDQPMDLKGEIVQEGEANTHTNDFVSVNAAPSKHPIDRGNHSKNRHMPIFTLNSASTNQDDTPQMEQKEKKEPYVSKKEPSAGPKKKTLEEKFVKLFKRKHHSANAKSPVNKNEHKLQHQDELKKKISKFRSKTAKAPVSSTRNVQQTRETRSTENRNSAKKEQDVPKEGKLTTEEKYRDRSDETQTIGFSDGTVTLEKDELPGLQPAVSVTSAKNTRDNGDVVETVRELDGDDSQDISGGDIQYQMQPIDEPVDGEVATVDDTQTVTAAAASALPAVISTLPPRKLTYADVKRPEKPNAPIQFTDSAFGFPLPMLTVSTVIMFDHRLGINVERAIYRLSHLKLSDSKRELRQQVLLSNFMYAYLNLVNHTLYMEQVSSTETAPKDSVPGGNGVQNGSCNNVDQMSSNSAFATNQNKSDGTILIPDIS
ncbi:Zds2p KNAG_0G03370 [Huiozyma naganishii CBS 8797]|uniref:Protein Zds1 C-terminal domain-containing protein n=1 Tax=Huiozyma naganishii (strain ATCC MYA-139 / BCRC 22969 / CBS 8797 / KCTC 17520 / NBRC 10181 / NCYC 3082 / Yp74L-3) TaxID=1071383 RepID=J7R948_HUIN7|nr:hypothetical protein KNAG_0G03370 [Kazachstania naganishii CBS 8797]CCK71395.1 hypothetical protein KNAG_0G03370 [Kazachstania naganishii CBS 8797]